MIRVRFHANPDDYRPITWPIKHPYWCSGYGEEYAILVAYVDSVEDVTRLWPEATNIDVLETDVSGYLFTSRFPRPAWFHDAPVQSSDGVKFHRYAVRITTDDEVRWVSTGTGTSTAVEHAHMYTTRKLAEAKVEQERAAYKKWAEANHKKMSYDIIEFVVQMT